VEVVNLGNGKTSEVFLFVYLEMLIEGNMSGGGFKKTQFVL
jgi:hypothetical protein